MEGDQRLGDWIKRVIADDNLVVRLANELPGRSYQSGGRHGTRIIWTFKRAEWAKLLDVEELFRRLEILASSNSDAAAALKRLQDAEVADRE